MNKWEKKIDYLSFYYDQTWDQVVEYHQQLGTPMPCERVLRRQAYRDGAERMRKEILHLLRSKKYRVEKLKRIVQEECPEQECISLDVVLSTYRHIINVLK